MAGFNILTVTQITSYLKSYISENNKLSGIYIKGEIADFRGNYYSGHLYFSLKDASSEISCVMFKSYAERLHYEPKDGLSVIVRCDLSVYQKTGSCQLYVYDMQPEGLGAKYLAFEQLKEKLGKEGLFDEEYKKKLPRFPEKIGVITSSQGAAVHDIINVLGRRWPLAKIVLVPSSVQGENAPTELAAAVIKQEKEVKPDLIIIGRGGGSSDDLSAFNDENLARTIFACKIPVVSAVGHETDFSICDFVSDMRAPTPSAAAEISSPDIRELRQTLDSNIEWLKSVLLNKISLNNTEISRYSSVKQLSLTERFRSLNDESQRLKAAFCGQVEKKTRQYSEAVVKLDSNNPAKILKKAVCSAEINGKKLTSIKEVSIGDTAKLYFSDGKLITEVKNIIEEDFESIEKGNEF